MYECVRTYRADIGQNLEERYHVRLGMTPRIELIVVFHYEEIQQGPSEVSNGGGPLPPPGLRRPLRLDQVLRANHLRLFVHDLSLRASSLFAILIPKCSVDGPWQHRLHLVSHPLSPSQHLPKVGRQT